MIENAVYRVYFITPSPLKADTKAPSNIHTKKLRELNERVKLPSNEYFSVENSTAREPLQQR